MFIFSEIHWTSNKSSHKSSQIGQILYICLQDWCVKQTVYSFTFILSKSIHQNLNRWSLDTPYQRRKQHSLRQLGIECNWSIRRSSPVLIHTSFAISEATALYTQMHKYILLPLQQQYCHLISLWHYFVSYFIPLVCFYWNNYVTCRKYGSITHSFAYCQPTLLQGDFGTT